MTPSLTLILGGARSGKSPYAEKLAAEMGQRVLFIATAEAKDKEMAERIAVHQAARPDSWQTLEAPRYVGDALSQIDHRFDVMILDCLTLLVSNIVLEMETQPQAAIEIVIQVEIERILAMQQQLNIPLIVVSNEVGLGLVPDHSLGRLYRDVLGRANQYLAARADRVLFMVAGLPLTVKNIEN
ncbi:MAG: bifunctional adenosylcobinamide kinase/adenosylcobinamide-phosphate guanylyltransferase [Anaerolineae bacterium]|nr:bifunctional adenosylcobinamide kinase/adenosylcobinamide-phosphate guanylyltransferase [Anaerolineae bacterium]